MRTKTRKQATPRSQRRQRRISETLARIGQLRVETPRAAQVIELLRSWLQDESGYDERTWPQLRKALDEERARAKARKLFDG